MPTLAAGLFSDIIIRAMAVQITGVSIVCSTVCPGADQRKHQSSASLAFGREIHRFLSQRTSNAENVSIWWRHNGFHLRMLVTCSFPTRSSQWWPRYEIETLSALVAFCEENPPFTPGFPSQKADNMDRWWIICCRLKKLLQIQLSCLWFEAP